MQTSTTRDAAGATATADTSGTTTPGGSGLKGRLRGAGFDDGAALLAPADEPRRQSPADAPAPATPSAVAGAYAAETAAIRRALKGRTSAADVLAVLQILSHWDRATIAAVWGSLAAGGGADAKLLGDLVRHVAREHVSAFPREVVESFAAAPAALRLERVDALVSHRALSLRVTAAEATTAVILLRTLSAAEVAAWQRAEPALWKAICDKAPADEVRALATAAASDDGEKDRETAQAARRADAQLDAETAAAAAGDAARLEHVLRGGPFRRVTGADAVHALELVEPYAGQPARLGAVVRRLEELGLVDRWLERLPDDARYHSHVVAFVAVLGQRPPEAALAELQRLLGRGLFDWRVTSQEARLAYYLVKSQPPSVQAALRQRDAGHWLDRMERHLGDDIAGHRTARDADGASSEQDAVLAQGFGTASSQAEADALAAADQALTGDDAAWQRFEALRKGIQFHRDLPAAYAELVALDDTLRLATVRRLDGLGLVEELLQGLGADFVWAPERRLDTLVLLSARDPMRCIAIVDDLIHDHLHGITAETDSEAAYLAYQLLKALPQRYRDLVRRQYPEWWGALDARENVSERRSDDQNMYRGGDEGGAGKGADRAALLTQLHDDALWQAEGAAAEQRLAGVLRMVIAAGQRKEANQQAIAERAFERHATLMAALGLVPDMKQFKGDGAEHDSPKTRTAYGATALAGKRGADLERGGKAGMSATLDVPLEQVQSAWGDDFYGIEVARTGDPEKNRVTGKLDPANGLIDIASVRLELASVRYPYDDISIQFGATTLDGLSVFARYGTQANAYQGPNIFKLHAATIALSDLLVTTPTGMVTAAKVTVSDVTLAMTELPMTPDALGPPGQPPAAVALRALGPLKRGLFAFLKNAYFAADDVTRAMEDPLLGGPGGMSFDAGAVTIEGVVKSDGSHVDKLETKGIHLSLEHLPSRLAQRQVASWRAALARADARLQASGAGAATEHERARLGREKAELTKKIAAAEAALPEQTKQDERYLELYRKQQARPLEPAEQAELEALQKSVHGGVVADIDSAHLEGYEGADGTRVGSADVGHVSASGDSAMVALSTVSNAEAIAGLVGAGGKGPGGKGAGAKAAGGDASSRQTDGGEVAIESVSAHDVALGGGVPDYPAIAARRRALREKAEPSEAEQTELAALEARWTTVLEAPHTYGSAIERLLEIEAGGLDALRKQPEHLDERAQLRQLLKAKATTIASIELRGVALAAHGAESKDDESDIGVARASASVGELEVRDIRPGDAAQGHIDRVSASDLTAKGRGAADLAGVMRGDLSGADVKGEVGVGSLTLSGVDNPASGTHVGEVSVKGFRAEAHANALESGASVDIDEIGVKDIRSASAITALDQRIRELAAKPRPTAAESDELAALREERQEYQALADERARLDAALAALPAPSKTAKKAAQKAAEAQRKKLRTALDAVAKQLARWEDPRRIEALGMKGFHAEAAAQGDALDRVWDPAGRAMTLAVTVKEDITAAPFAFASPDLAIEAQSATLGGFSGQLEIDVRKSGGEDGKPPQWAFVPTRLKSLNVTKSQVTGLRLRTAVEGELVRLSVSEASIEGLHAHDLPLSDLTLSALADGQLSLDQAKVKASASIGTYFKAHASASVKGLGFERAESGKVAFGMDDLTLSGLGLHGGKIPKGSLVESFAGTDFKAEKIGALKARAELDPTTGAVTVKASLGVARLADIAWAGDTTALRAHGAEVSGASLEASLKVDAAFLESLGKEGKVSAAAIARSLKIERAHIERIAGTDIRYSDPDLPPIYLAKGRFEGIDVSGLDLTTGKGAFDLASAHLETATGENGTASARWPEFLQTLLEKAGTDLLKASAEVDIDGVHVQRMGDGKTTFALQQLVAGARAEADARNAVGARVKATKWSGERDDKSGEVTAHGGIVASGGAKWSAPYTPNSEASAGLTANVDITQNKTGAQVGIHDGHLQATIPALPAGAQTLTFEGIEGGLKVDDHGYTVDARLAELGVKKLVVASTSGTLVLGEATLDDIALELSAHLVAGKDNKAVIDRVDIPLVSMTSAHIDDGRFIAPDKTEIEFGGGSIEGLEIDDTSIAFGDDATVLKSGTVHVDRLAGRVGEKLAKAGNLSAKGIGFVSASDGSSYVGIEQIQAARAELKQRGDPEGDGYSLEEVVAVGVAASTGADGHGAASAASVEAKASGAGRGKQYVSGDQAGDPAASAIDWDLDALDHTDGTIAVTLPDVAPSSEKARRGLPVTGTALSDAPEEMLGGRHELKVKDGKATKVGKNSPVEDLVAWYFAELRLRSKLEAKLNRDFGKAPTKGSVYDLETLAQTASKGMTLLGLDFLPPAEVKALVKGAELSVALTADGRIDSWRTPTRGAAATHWLAAKLHAGIGAEGSLGSTLMASILAQLSDLRVTTESGVTAEADTVDVTTEASTKLGSDESLKTQGQSTVSATAVRVTY